MTGRGPIISRLFVIAIVSCCALGSQAAATLCPQIFKSLIPDEVFDFLRFQSEVQSMLPGHPKAEAVRILGAQLKILRAKWTLDEIKGWQRGYESKIKFDSVRNVESFGNARLKYETSREIDIPIEPKSLYSNDHFKSQQVYLETLYLPTQQGSTWSANEKVVVLLHKRESIAIDVETGKILAKYLGPGILNSDGSLYGQKNISSGDVEIVNLKTGEKRSVPGRFDFARPDLFTPDSIGLLDSIGEFYQVALKAKELEAIRRDQPKFLYLNDQVEGDHRYQHVTFRHRDGRQVEVRDFGALFDSPHRDMVIAAFDREGNAGWTHVQVIDLEAMSMSSPIKASYTSVSPNRRWLYRFRGDLDKRLLIEYYDLASGLENEIKSVRDIAFLGESNFIIYHPPESGSQVVIDLADPKRQPVLALHSALAGASPSGRYIISVNPSGKLVVMERK